MANTAIDLNINPQDDTQTSASGLMEELNQMSTENKKLTETLFFQCENYNSLQGKLMDFMHKNSENVHYSKSKKRNAEYESFGGATETNGDSESNLYGGGGNGGANGGGGWWKRPKDIKITSVSRVHAKIDPFETSLAVKDGYQWRKYGQKVTRDNPSPRAYYKCSFSPNCPVKKKVQRSVQDPSLLVAIYEGEHNHQPPCQAEVPLGLNNHHHHHHHHQGVVPSLISALNSATSNSIPGIDMPASQQLLAEKMANSLAANTGFTMALAAAISSKILDHLMEPWENTTNLE